MQPLLPDRGRLRLLFHTHEFLALLAITLLAYRLVPALRSWVLLVSSLSFYAYAGLGMTVLFLSVVLVNYACYRRIGKGRGLAALSFAIVLDLANLFFFKYTVFFLTLLGNAGLELVAPRDWAAANLILPVGISFYTFQLIALLVDRYRGSEHHARDLYEFLLFVSFFGQLIAGPIMRGNELLPQLSRLGLPDANRLASGSLIFTIGLFKKVVFADFLLAPRVDALFAQATLWDAPTSWFLGILFGFQIYYDFSGYCDMAVGLGRLFGLELSVNFDTPYVSRSPSEFWNRWNITLSRWFGDYVYIPLGGSRLALPRTVANLMLTLLVSGLWHGAGTHFVVWGGIHGLAVAGFHLLRSGFPRLRDALERGVRSPVAVAMWATTYAITVVAWVYFRAGSLDEANGVVRRMFGIEPGTARGDLTLLTALSGFLLALHFVEAFWWRHSESAIRSCLGLWQRIPGPIQAAAVFPLLFVIVAMTKKVQGAFIYFQF